MTTVRREPRRVRRARRAAAFHAARSTQAATPAARFRAAADALVSAAKHTRRTRTVRELREDMVEHVDRALDEANVSESSRAHYQQRMRASGSDVQRLGVAVMCLQGVINRLPATERDRLFEHYTDNFESEIKQFHAVGGAR